MTNKDVANALEDVAKVKKAKGANKFSIGAYKKAAMMISNLAMPVTELDIDNTKGIGDKIAAHIKEYLATGKIQFVQDNLSCLNADQKIEELLKIEGIGDKTALKIYETLHISTIAELKKAVEDGRINQVLKEKGIENLKRGIEYLETTRGRIRLDEGLAIGIQIHSYIKSLLLPISRIEFGGSLRRSKETIGDIDIALEVKSFDDADLIFTTLIKGQINKPSPIDKFIDKGDKKMSVWIKGVKVDFYLFTRDIFESGLMHLTGNAEHNKQLRILAIQRGYILSQYGIYKRGPNDEKEGDRLDDGTEVGIYKMLGLQFVPPEHREASREFIQYTLQYIAFQLIKESDVTFDLHTHSNFSDGSSSIEDMIKHAISLGLRGIAITDHSQSLKIAKGLSVEKLQEKKAEIIRLRKEYPQLKILYGTECDIHGDGTLDYPDDVLREFDIVIASIHSPIKTDVTEIYKSAIRTGRVHIIGHITGRLINSRAEHICNYDEILEQCARYNVAVELNAQPNRLDANEYLLQRCKVYGVKVAIGSDAHEKNQMIYIKTFGLWTAKRGWLTKDDLLESTVV